MTYTKKKNSHRLLRIYMLREIWQAEIIIIKKKKNVETKKVVKVTTI